MRTTLTLDDDLAERLTELAHRTRRPFKAVVNAAIRRGLGAEGKSRAIPPFKVKAHTLRLRPGLDDRRLNQLVDELEAEAAGAKLKAGR